MCIVLDANCFSKVFNSDNAEHAEFRPILAWIVEGDGCLVYGGTRYKAELAAARRYLGIFVELGKLGKVRQTDDAKVDARETAIQAFLNPAKHGDPHLPAIVCACGCRLVCTDDAKACALLKDRRCYPREVTVPSLYTSSRNSDLLCPKYIAEFCKPSVRLPKRSQKSVSNVID